jgi:CRISPR-associated exonuclease Cas4
MNPYLLSILLITIGLLLLNLAKRGRATLPRGRLIYIDSRQLSRTPESLCDPRSGLTGRPDYLIQSWRMTIPVEVKSMMAPQRPHEAHVLQLAAYCHLVEVNVGPRPSHGVIRYRDRSFRVNYTRALRQELSKTLDAIRRSEASAPNRSHNHPARCQACGYQSYCDQSLA